MLQFHHVKLGSNLKNFLFINLVPKKVKTRLDLEGNVNLKKY